MKKEAVEIVLSRVMSKLEAKLGHLELRTGRNLAKIDKIKWEVLGITEVLEKAKYRLEQQK